MPLPLPCTISVSLSRPEIQGKPSFPDPSRTRVKSFYPRFPRVPAGTRVTKAGNFAKCFTNNDIPGHIRHIAYRVHFLDKIDHPRVDKEGQICLGILQDEWHPAFHLRTVLVSIRSLLSCKYMDNPSTINDRIPNDPNATRYGQSCWQLVTEIH